MDQIAQVNPLSDATKGIGNLNDLLGGIFGKSGAGSKTTSSIDSEGLMTLLQNILGGTQGLASISSGENSAGLYDSVTQTLLSNDFLTQAAGEVAANNKTVTIQGSKTPGLIDNILGPVGKVGKIFKGIF